MQNSTAPTRSRETPSQYRTMFVRREGSCERAWASAGALRTRTAAAPTMLAEEEAEASALNGISHANAFTPFFGTDFDGSI